MSTPIAITTLLSKLDDTYNESTGEVKNYGIRFLKADGTTREMMCSKKTLGAGRNGNRKFNHNLKQKGTIMVTDLSINKERTPKVALIYQFKDHNSSTWKPVFH